MAHDQLLLKAAAVYDDANWGQGANFDSANNAYCVSGALRKAAFGNANANASSFDDTEQAKLFRQARATLLDVLLEDYVNEEFGSSRSLVHWNDVIAKSKAEVVRKLKKAATRARKEHKKEQQANA